VALSAGCTFRATPQLLTVLQSPEITLVNLLSAATADKASNALAQPLEGKVTTTCVSCLQERNVGRINSSGHVHVTPSVELTLPPTGRKFRVVGMDDWSWRSKAKTTQPSALSEDTHHWRQHCLSSSLCAPNIALTPCAASHVKLKLTMLR